MPLPIITHLGAEDCVTGSCHLMKANAVTIMVDCGLAQGRDTLRKINDWPIKPSEIDYLFLTHAHIDHIGRISELIQHGFKGEIICSHPTKALLNPMLRDAMRFSELSPQSADRLQTKIDDLTWVFEFSKAFDLEKGLAFKMARAGHILGSSSIRLQIQKADGPCCFQEIWVPVMPQFCQIPKFRNRPIW